MKFRNVTVDMPSHRTLSGTLELTKANALHLFDEPQFAEKAKRAVKNAGKRSAAIAIGTGAGIIKDPEDALSVTASLAGAIVKKQMNPTARVYPSPGAKAAGDRLWDSIKTNIDNVENHWFPYDDTPDIMTIILEPGFKVYMESDQTSIRLMGLQNPKILRLFFQEPSEALRCFRKLDAVSKKTG